MGSGVDPVGNVERECDDDACDHGDQERIGAGDNGGNDAVNEDENRRDKSDEGADCFLFSDDETDGEENHDTPEKAYQSVFFEECIIWFSVFVGGMRDDDFIADFEFLSFLDLEKFLKYPPKN